MRYKYNFLFSFLGLTLLLLLDSCKKLVDVSPPKTAITSANAFFSDASAAAVLTGIYTNMAKYHITGGTTINGFMSFYAGLSSDEFTLTSTSNSSNMIKYYKNALSNVGGPNVWLNIYPSVYICNQAVEELTNNTQLTTSVKQQLLGEAKFLRGLYYFYLVNLYGDVPLVISTDYTVNATLARTSKDKVYQQIIADLKDAQQLMSTDYLQADVLKTSTDRFRPTTWAATALLSRVYLFMGNWADAETQSSIVINKTGLFSLSGLDAAFLNNSSEAIWQLQPVNLGWNTEDARSFIIPPGGPTQQDQPLYLSTFLLNSFEAGDLRRTHWVDSVTVGSDKYLYPYKYKSATLNAPVTESEMVLRLGEQLLIRAEASARQNNISGALDDLNAIRHRAGLSDYAGAQDQASVLEAILHECQVEFFSEWGHRWMDLKRTGNIDAVMSVVTPAKGGTWDTRQQLYPISSTELIDDPNLVQNPGYN